MSISLQDLTALRDHYDKPEPLFVDLFTNRVVEYGNAKAVTFDRVDFTYAQLHKLSVKFAKQLTKLGVNHGSRVAVSIDRSENTIALLIAIWMCRAAYIPVDPHYPDERKHYIVDSSNTDLLITDTLGDWVPENTRNITLIQLKACEEVSSFSNLTNHPGGHEQDLAYIMFTSGSTGRPKGVMITQSNVINFLLGMQEILHFTANDKLLAVTTISFDIHVLELFLPLTIGAQIILASRADTKHHEHLRELILTYSVSVMQATPATWRMVLADDWQCPWPMTRLVGGEALLPDLRQLLHNSPGQLWNMYGPTETTVWSTCHLVDPKDEQIFIGTPIRNTDIYIVNEHCQSVGPGTQGELLIGGAGAAQGYLNNPELTQEKFIPFGKENKIVYRTGDRVLLHDSGLIEYIDRIDHQIKLRGHRIEPKEIEHVIIQLPEVVQVEVISVKLSEQDVRLVVCYTGAPIDQATLRSFCKERLPEYMVPQNFIQCEELPLTENLKVNRLQLGTIAAAKLSNTIRKNDLTGSPRDDLDRGLIHVWSEALGVDDTGIDDNFFDLGGHSLLALKVSQEMHRTCGLNISPTLIFSAPSIRQLRDNIGEKANATATAIKLNRCITGAPIFCLCGVMIYQKLANLYEHKRPVYGVFTDVETAYFENRREILDLDRENLSRLVQQYVLAIKRQGVNNKLSLVGLSFGGFIALEVAKALKQDGFEIISVILVDSYYSGSRRRLLSKTIADLFLFAQTNGLKRLVSKSVAKLQQRWLDLHDKRRQAQKALNDAEAIRTLAYTRATKVFESHTSTYHFDVLLIRTIGTTFGLGYYVLPDYGLSKMVTGEIKVSAIEGFHSEIMYDDIQIKATYDAIQTYESSHH